jgi:preprotein translocase SecE subunit
MGSNKYLHFFFGCGALVLALLLALSLDWVWNYFAKPPQLTVNLLAIGIAAIVTIVAYRNDRFYNGIADIFHELEKVTWPTRQETSSATVVVIVTVVIASLILSAIDTMWSFLTSRVLS